MVFYIKKKGQETKVLQAQFVNKHYPKFIRGACVTLNERGNWELNGKEARLGDIWVRYNDKEAEIISVDKTEEIKDVLICTDTSETLLSLSEFLKKLSDDENESF